MKNKKKKEISKWWDFAELALLIIGGALSILAGIYLGINNEIESPHILFWSVIVASVIFIMEGYFINLSKDERKATTSRSEVHGWWNCKGAAFMLSLISSFFITVFSWIFSSGKYKQIIGFIFDNAAWFLIPLVLVLFFIGNYLIYKKINEK